jgi:preprotein translocase subunit SecG
VWYYFLLALYILSCFILILFVLLQPGKSDAAAVFGGGASSTAFGPRGTQTVLAKITIGAAVAFFLLAFLFAIPNVGERRSVAEGVPAESAAPAPAPAPQSETQTPPAAEQTGGSATQQVGQPQNTGEAGQKQEAGKPADQQTKKDDSKK